MHAIVDIGFDYSELDATGRDEVREAAVRIRLRMSRTVQDIIEIGRDLLLAKGRIGHGGFIRWIEAEFGMGEQTARNFMQVARRFKSPTVGDLPAAVLYALASPSTADEVVDEVKERAANGKAVTVDDVRELKRQLQNVRDKARGAKSQNADLWAQLETVRAENATLRTRPAAASQGPPASHPVTPADRPMNELEAYHQWLAEGVRWVNRGSAEWRDKAREHLFREPSVTDRRYGSFIARETLWAAWDAARPEDREWFLEHIGATMDKRRA